MKDTLRDECDDSEDCLENCCINQVIKGFFSKKIICFFSDFGPSVFCGVCAAGPVCACQCGGGCAHEAPGGDTQASQV